MGLIYWWVVPYTNTCTFFSYVFLVLPSGSNITCHAWLGSEIQWFDINRRSTTINSVKLVWGSLIAKKQLITINSVWGYSLK